MRGPLHAILSGTLLLSCLGTYALPQEPALDARKKAELKKDEKPKPPERPASAPGTVGNGSLTPHSQRQKKPAAAHLHDRGSLSDASRHGSDNINGLPSLKGEKATSSETNHQQRIHQKDEKGEKESHSPCEKVSLTEREKCEEERKTRVEKILGSAR
jgi:hypothetical protein